MSDKLLLTVIFAVVGTLIGMIINKSLLERKKYFEDVEHFLSEFISNLNFKRETIKVVFTNYLPSSEILKKQIKCHIDNNFQSLNFSSILLSKTEVKFTNDIFSEIGLHSIEVEKTFVNDCFEKIKSVREKVEIKYKKLGSASIKLGFLCGLMLAVLFW
ncbi:MAG: hypothetical protein IKM44_00790 [Clostridia bacterium]|nr:hypothetical protein [Clostridia bacterium]